MTDRINLTAEEAREFNETGRVELWTEIDFKKPNIIPDDFDKAYQTKLAGEIMMAFRKNKTTWYRYLPHGPNGERWVAEPFCIFDETMRIIYEATYDPDIEFSHLPKGHGRRDFPSESINWGCAEFMCKDESRANANITTDVKQRDGVFRLLTVVERKVE